jgi:hypothetical protein
VTAFSVVAIIAAYNEEDIIGQVVGDLIEQGISVYLLDHDSTDGTVAAVEPYLGRGVLGIERFADRVDVAGQARFPWGDILRRKEALARELPAAWFIHNDADEFRESPWTGVRLLDAIQRVDTAGYNAIDSARFDFWPVHDRFKPGDDVRETFRFCEPAPLTDRLQIRCWKRFDGAVDLASSGGHEVRFPGRKVFPIRFIVRHYPVRSQAHGERKVFVERRARYLQSERDQGWHVQYDAFLEGQSFVRDPSTLGPWDPDAIRVALTVHHRGVEQLGADLDEARQTLDETRAALGARTDDLARRLAEVETLRIAVEEHAAEAEHLRTALEQRGAEVQQLRTALEQRVAEAERLRIALEQRAAEAEHLRIALEQRAAEAEHLRTAFEQRAAEIAQARTAVEARAAEVATLRREMQRRLDDVYASRSWRWTAPLRAAFRVLTGRVA